MLLVRLTLAAIVSLLPIVLEGSYGLPLTGDEAEAFLRDARITVASPAAKRSTPSLSFSSC